jgi:hypothetical protein
VSYLLAARSCLNAIDQHAINDYVFCLERLKQAEGLIDRDGAIDHVTLAGATRASCRGREQAWESRA